MLGVKYTGAFRDYSGYGEAARHEIVSLYSSGIYVIPELVSYAFETSDFGSLGQTTEKLIHNSGEYRIKILHITPDQYYRHFEPDKYHIGRFFWETDRLPKDFADGLNLVDEVWTGSQANAEAIKNSGVDKPIYIFPQATETERDWPEPYEIPDFDGYLFYSIFEWTERKNPKALITAYCEEFQNGENVALLLKTYNRNFVGTSKTTVRSELKQIKRKLILKQSPRVFAYLNLMGRKQVMRIHQTGDCFVSAHRGEGWGVPQVEAMLAGNPIISTGYGGVHEYIDENSGLMLPYSMVPVNFPERERWYSSDQNWAEVDSKELRKAMRLAFEGKLEKMGKAGQALVKDKFNLKTVGLEMKKRLEQI